MFNALIVIPLLYAAIKDYKTMTIPIWLFPLTTMIHSIITALAHEYINWTDKIIGFVVCAFAYIVISIWFKGGGADIIMMSALGWMLGFIIIVKIILIASIITSFVIVIYSIIKKNDIRKVVVPYAPSVFIAYIVFLLFSYSP